jgi:putative PIN family toxin of toxin-antitoxin system
MSRTPQVVLDTNVVYSGLRSRRGASFKALSLLGTGRFQIHLSVPLVLEYEEVLREQIQDLGLTEADISDVLDYMCQVGDLHEIHFLWRPRLKDPDDEMVLECAVKAGCDCIVTHNKADFQRVEPFGIELVTAQELLQQIGALS